MRTIIELIAYCGSAMALTVFGDIWLTEVLYSYRLRHRSFWGLTNGFSVLDVKRLGDRLVQLGRPGILGQTAKGSVLSGLQAPDVLIVDYTYLVRHYRGGATGGLSARRATTLVMAEVSGRSMPMEVQPRARRLSLRRLLHWRSRPTDSAMPSPGERRFDQEFRVLSGDEDGASENLTPAVRAAMLERPHASFELGGRYLVADERRLLFGEDLLALIATVRRLRDALPVQESMDARRSEVAPASIWSRTGVAIAHEVSAWRRPRTGAQG